MLQYKLGQKHKLSEKYLRQRKRYHHPIKMAVLNNHCSNPHLWLRIFMQQHRMRSNYIYRISVTLLIGMLMQLATKIVTNTNQLHACSLVELNKTFFFKFSSAYP